MTLSDGYAPMPEQSTVAIVAHHPQAVYFGMGNGRLLPDGSPDDVIKGSPGIRRCSASSATTSRPRAPSRPRTPRRRRAPRTLKGV